MITQNGYSEHIPRGMSGWLSGHWRELVGWLPEPGKEWIFSEVRDECPYSGPEFRVLSSKGVVEVVRRERGGAVYTTCEQAYTRVLEYESMAG